MSKNLENLLEAVIDQKPAEFREIFDELMVEKLREKLKAHEEVVSGKLFDTEEESDDEEDEQLDEISKKKLGRYVRKNVDAQHNAKAAWNKYDPISGEKPNKDAAKKASHALKKRQKGFDKAVDRLSKEEEQLAEAGYNKDAVDKQIKKDRVGKGESKKIHSLLKGRQRGDGDTADWKEKEEQRRFARNRRHA